MSFAIGLIGAVPGCILAWVQWAATHDQLELSESRYERELSEYRKQLEAWNVLPEARKMAVQEIRGSNELSDGIKSRLVEGLLEGVPTWADLPVEDKLFHAVVARILAQVPTNEGRVDGRAFALHVREELKEFRGLLGEADKEASWFRRDLYTSFDVVGPELKSSVFGRVPGQQPEQPVPPEPGSLIEYLWPLLFPFLGFFVPWLTIRSIAWIVEGFLKDRRSQHEN